MKEISVIPRSTRVARLSAVAAFAVIPASLGAAPVSGMGLLALPAAFGVAGGAVLAGLAAWWWMRRTRHALEHIASERVRRSSELIERAECLLWEADVRLEGSVWHWNFRVHPSALSRRILDNDAVVGRRLWYAGYEVPEHAEMNRRAREALDNNWPGYEQEFRLVRGGVTLWLHERVSILAQGHGHFSLVGLATDRTALREAEAARQQSELIVDRILAHAQCMLWRATVENRHGELHWSSFDVPHSQFSEILFGERVGHPGSGFWDKMSVPDQPDMNRRSTEAIFSGSPGYQQQFRAINRTGRLFWLHERVSITPVNATTWNLVGVLTDVTVQREAEDARRRSELRLSFLLELADCLVWEATVALENGQLVWDIYTLRSVLYRRIFGDDESTQLNWDRVVVPEQAEMAARALHAVRTSAEGYTQEFHVEKPDGVIWLREVVTMVKLPSGLFRLVGVVTDITGQRVAEHAQHESESRLSALLDRADCMIWQGQVRRVPGSETLTWEVFTPSSNLYRRLFGAAAAGEPRFGWDEKQVPEHGAMRRRAHEALVQGLPGYEQSFSFRHPEGEIWLHEKVSIKPAGTDRWELIGIITDVTARHLSEMARATSERRLQELLARADCLLWESITTLHPDGGWDWQFHIQPSGLWAHLHGGSAPPRSELSLWRDFDIPERAEIDERCRSALRQGQSGYDQIFRVLRPDGVVIWISESVTIRPLGGDRFSLVGVAVDITPLRGAEEALAAQKERLSVTLRAMSEAVITTDVDGLVQFMNPAAAALTGWSEDEAFGRALGDVCHFENERTAEPLELPVARVARGDRVSDLPPHSQLLTRNGQRRLIQGCCAPIHAADSKVTGTVLVFRDVTEHERLEQELVRATRLESVGVLAGGIAHDFNNILTAVMGNLALAQMDTPPDAPVMRSLRSAEKAALRARDLTQQLLTFAKGGEPVRAAVQLEAIVREMTSFALHGSQVKAYFDLAPDLWPADADKGQIGRVVQNLVINAVQAMPEGGTLRVIARNDPSDGLTIPGLAPGSYIQISIADTGEGIAPEHVSRIFDPYFTTKKTGTGLGLAAVYSIVKKHRGHIDVESQRGEGTTFRIWLPALRQRLESAESRAPWTPGPMNGRVLFMDDEEIIRTMAVSMLGKFGLAVDCAVDGAEAVAKYRISLSHGPRYDLVIMDLTIPGGMGGLAAVKELRALDPQVRAIVSSGYSSDPVMANYREHGFAGMVAKPYEISEFARVLREVLPVG